MGKNFRKRSAPTDDPEKLSDDEQERRYSVTGKTRLNLETVNLAKLNDEIEGWRWRR